MPKTPRSSEKIEYFATSLKRLALLSLFTMGFYQLYWFYKNWDAIKKANGLKISPFWRAVFSILWVYPLFKEVLNSAKAQGYKAKYTAKVLAAIFILSYIAASFIGWDNYEMWVLVVTLALLVVNILPLLVVQAAINSHNKKLKLDLPQKHKRTRNETIIIVIGVVLFVLLLLSFLYPGSNELTPEQQSLLDKANTLGAEYEDCSTALKLKEDSLNLNDQAAVNEYNAEAGRCDEIRAQQNEAADMYDASVGL